MPDKTQQAPITGGVSYTPEAVAALMAENATLKAKLTAKNTLVVKLSAPDKVTGKSKGAISVYGLQRFPVTLYATQWERLFAIRDQIEAALKLPGVVRDRAE